MNKKDESTDLQQIYNQHIQLCLDLKKVGISTTTIDLLPKIQSLEEKTNQFLNLSQINKIGNLFAVQLIQKNIKELLGIHAINVNKEAKTILNSINHRLNNYLAFTTQSSKTAKLLNDFQTSFLSLRLKSYEFVGEFPGLCLLALFLEQQKDKQKFCFENSGAGSDTQILACFKAINDVNEELQSNKKHIEQKKSNTYFYIFNLFEKTAKEIKSGKYIAESKTTIELPLSEFSDEVSQLNDSTDSFCMIENNVDPQDLPYLFNYSK